MLKRLFLSLPCALAVASLIVVGCTQAAPAPTPTRAPAPPTKVAEPTKPAAAAPAPTKAPEPTKAAEAPAKKVDFPQKGKTITMIMPWPAGGATDVGGRLLAAAMEKELGVPVQVVNKPGAGSQVGVTELAMSKPDGYTIGMTNVPSALTPYVEPDRKAAYGRKDLVQVANQVWDPESIAVKADGPYKDLKDLVDAAKAKPEQIKMSATGVFSDTHMGLLLFQKAAGVKFSIVQFDGGAPATTALLGGHIDASEQTAGNYPTQFKAGQVRILAIMDDKPSKFFPGVKTLKEQGYNVTFGSARGISVPAGTPKEIVDILGAAIKKGMENEELKKKMDEMALEQRYLDAAQYAALWDQVEAQARALLPEIKN